MKAAGGYANSPKAFGGRKSRDDDLYGRWWEAHCEGSAGKERDPLLLENHGGRAPCCR